MPDVVVDPDGTEHVRFDGTTKKMRVLGGDMLSISRNGAFCGEELAFAGTMRPSIQANVSAAAAAGIAQGAFRGRGRVTSQELLVFLHEGSSPLAYEVVVSGVLPSGVTSALHVIVDAQRGRVQTQGEGMETVRGTGEGVYYGKVALETTAQNGRYLLQDPTCGTLRPWDMNDQTNKAPVLLRDDDKKWGNGRWNDRAPPWGWKHQWCMAMVWDYVKVTHGRRGIFNNGTGFDSRIHYDTKLANASWAPECLCANFGDGDGRTDGSLATSDVMGHEMSHGITSATGNLAYRGESGGLNEATSDIFGSMVEFFANLSKDAPDYLIGEKLHVSNPSGTKALRYMDKRSLDGKPPDCCSNTVKRLDVHDSSGIFNHFYDLLAEGAAPAAGPASPTCNGSSITGIGREKALRIWFRALTTYMTSSTTYSGARTARMTAAKSVYGAIGLEANTVAAAWSAAKVP